MNNARKKRILSVHDDIRERHRKRQIRKKRTRFALFCVLMLLLFVLAASAVVFLTPWFHVTDVSVVGNAQVEAADLIAASGINKGESIFSYNMHKVENALLEVPYIKTVQAKRKLPKTVVLTVTESHAVASIEQDTLPICIDETGEVVYAGSMPPEGLVTVTGLSVAEYTLGAPLKPENEKQYETLLELISIAEAHGCFSEMHSIDVTKAEDIRFTYGQGLTVICGDAYDLSRKILTFIEVARELPPNAKGEIDLRISSKAYYRP